ncbi:TolC family protein [Synechococcus sp. LA31]|uniref:TolC family protein n=1 Tax=Synechococcus sp. LA31 TaxID=2741953 RepID=UPI001BDCE752|nr:TolC family protein [Synechococcus sp. LA31]QVV67490.1 TolC family protein [Synechococcus sp. LA31]
MVRVRWAGLLWAALMPMGPLVDPARASPPTASSGLPPSPGLLRSLAAFERDLQALDGALSPGAVAPERAFDLADPALRAPDPAALPLSASAVDQVQERVLSLAQALEVAVANNPELAERRAQIAQMRGLKRSVLGRFWPRLGLNLGGAFSQRSDTNLVLQDNAGLYPPTSPFLVEPDGWSRIQTNRGSGWGSLDMDWELISFERGAALAEQDQRLSAALRQYGDALRELQLKVSEAYYGLQLAEQLLRIREAVVRNDSLVRDQVAALKGAGLVPRLDLLRAEAALQQSRFRQEQAEAMRLSRRQALTNLLNVAFGTLLLAETQVELQPAWPLPLDATVLAGLRDNPSLEQLAAERNALMRQADRRQAQLLPSLNLFAAGGGGTDVITKPVIDLEGCCSATNIPQLSGQSADWVAGLRLHWRLFDAGVSSGAAQASRAAAEAVLQRLARQRNQIRQELETAFYDYRASLSQLAAAEASYRASREAFRDARARYQLGLADYTDVSETITLLTRSMEGIAESTTLANLSYARMLRQLQPVPDQPQQDLTLPITLPAALVQQLQPQP